MQNKVAIITGASSGIGRQTAVSFAIAGYDTVIVATNTPALHDVANHIINDHKRQCLPVTADLSDLKVAQTIAHAALERFGRIDVLVNNAAWRTIETMRTITVEDWEITLRICVSAPAFLAKSCVAIMEEKNTRGVIVNVSSIMSQRAGGNSPAYIASKGALESLTRELAVTYGRSGIRVICVKPGYIDTNMSQDYSSTDGTDISKKIADELLNHTPLTRPGSVHDIANGIVWLASDNAAYVTGCELIIDGGLTHNFSGYNIKHQQFPEQF